MAFLVNRREKMVRKNSSKIYTAAKTIETIINLATLHSVCVLEKNRSTSMFILLRLIYKNAQKKLLARLLFLLFSL